MKYYDLYGAIGITAEDLQQAVGSALNVSFQERYSDEIGPYFNADAGSENFTVESNFLDVGDEEEIQEPEFADQPVLLYVNGTERGDQIRELLLAIPGLEHLRRDTRA